VRVTGELTELGRSCMGYPQNWQRSAFRLGPPHDNSRIVDNPYVEITSGLLVMGKLPNPSDFPGHTEHVMQKCRGLSSGLVQLLF
jgi:hypothetical protein